MTAALRHRWFLLAAIALAVLLLHLGALSLLGPAWFDPEGPPVAAATMQVRSLALPAPPVMAPLPATRVAETPPPARPPVPRSRAASPATAPAAATPASAMAESPEPAELGGEPLSAAALAAVDVPVYPTRLPPAGQWHYRMQRGLLVGSAELEWTLQADARYTLHLQGRVAGMTVLDWASQGQLDAAGVAPERFAVRRRGRDTHAANFQRAAGKLTFSGPTRELPLLPGAQDRLSWMLQLPAIVAAAPERFVAGASVLLFVAGARGDAEVWTFVVMGPELLGDTPTLKLVREPTRIYGIRAEVWLDPAAHYLPLRALQTPSGGGAALELLREPN